MTNNLDFFKIKSFSTIDSVVYYENENGNNKILPIGSHLKYRGAFNLTDDIVNIIVPSLTNFVPCHHVLYIGDNKIVHFTGGSGGNSMDPKNAIIEYNSLDTIKQWAKERNSDIYCCFHPDASSEDIIKERYLSIIGTKGYNILNNNCEHIVNYCITGDKKIKEAESTKKIKGLIKLSIKSLLKKFEI
jgi:hypothetical protein